MIGEKRKPKEALTLDQAKGKKAKSVSKITVETTSTSKPLSGKTRIELMEDARVKGIKYFRILTKRELEVVLTCSLDPTDGRTHTEIIESAKARWKAGWGSKKAVSNA